MVLVGASDTSYGDKSGGGGGCDESKG